MRWLGFRLALVLVPRFVWFYWKTRKLSDAALRKKAHAEARRMQEILKRSGIEVHFCGRLIAPPAILACQHQSWLETAILYAQSEHIVFVAKQELQKIPILGDFLTRLGCIFTNRQRFTRKDSLTLKTQVQKRLDAGVSVVIFPEGTRAKVSRIKRGVGLLYRQLSAPLQIITLDTEKCFPDGTPWSARQGSCHICFGEVIQPSTLTVRALLDCIEDAFGLKEANRQTKGGVKNGSIPEGGDYRHWCGNTAGQ